MMAAGVPDAIGVFSNPIRRVVSSSAARISSSQAVKGALIRSFSGFRRLAEGGAEQVVDGLGLGLQVGDIGAAPFIEAGDGPADGAGDAVDLPPALLLGDVRHQWPRHVGEEVQGAG